MRYRIESDCRIHYTGPVREHHVQIRLAPWESEIQSRTLMELQVSPHAQAVARHDGFGNLSHHFAVLGAHDTLEFHFIAEVQTLLSNPFDFTPIPPSREASWLEHSLHEAPRLWDFVLHQGVLTAALPESIGGHPIPEWDDRSPLLSQIQESFGWVQSVAEYDPEASASVCTLPALFEAGRGTAADLSHLLIALLRRWGIPARFVAGYQDPAYFDPDDEAPPGTPPRPQTLHHWVEALIPGAGWRGFDPALGLIADDSYIRVAVGRDGDDVGSLRHTSKGSGEEAEITQTLHVTQLEDSSAVDQTPRDDAVA